MVSEITSQCRDIYAEVNKLYARVAPKLGAYACGFRILYGPPRFRPPILFVGYQPGGKASDEKPEEMSDWPDECEYADAAWPLAKRMRAIWGAEDLRECTGINANFFRSPSMKVWQHSLDAGTRKEVEYACLQQCEKVTAILEPQKIVVIGFGTFHLLTTNSEVAISNGAKALVKSGKVWGREAEGLVHLSGARLSKADLEKIKWYYRSEILPRSEHGYSQNTPQL